MLYGLLLNVGRSTTDLYGVPWRKLAESGSRSSTSWRTWLPSQAWASSSRRPRVRSARHSGPGRSRRVPDGGASGVVPSLGLEFSRGLAILLNLEEDTVSESIALRDGLSVPSVHMRMMRDFLTGDPGASRQFQVPMPPLIQAAFLPALFHEQEREFTRRGPDGLDEITEFYPRGVLGLLLRRRERALRGVAGISPRGAVLVESIPRRPLSRVIRLTPRSLGIVEERVRPIVTLTERGRGRRGRPIAELAR